MAIKQKAIEESGITAVVTAGPLTSWERSGLSRWIKKQNADPWMTTKGPCGYQIL